MSAADHITATPVPWHADPPYEGTHRLDTEAAWRRHYRAASHVLVYGNQHVARHTEGYVR